MQKETIYTRPHQKIKQEMISYPVELSTDLEFKKTVDKLIKKYAIEEIIETGIGTGKGSTLIFAKTNLPVCSIECNAKHIAVAKKHLKDYPNVSILHGYSLEHNEMVKFIFKDSIYGKKLRLKREGGSRAPLYYLQEISCSAPAEDLLIKLINNDKKQLILLDSSGGIGYLEFKKFMSMSYLKKKVLMLDDIQHVKHYRSVQELKKKGIKFHYSSSKRWIWAKF